MSVRALAAMHGLQAGCRCAQHSKLGIASGQECEQSAGCKPSSEECALCEGSDGAGWPFSRTKLPEGRAGTGLPPRFCVHVARVRLPDREGKLAGLGGMCRSVTGKSECGRIMIGPCLFLHSHCRRGKCSQVTAILI